MKLQLRFLFVLAAIFAVLSALLFVQHDFEQQRSHNILASELATKRTYFANITSLTGHSQQTLAQDYSFWDDMITFIRGTDDTFAHENIDTSLTTYAVDTAWVYRPDGSLRYFVAADGTSSFRQTSLPPAFFVRLASSTYLHFYVTINGQLLEVQAATIVPSDDPKHHLPAQGFLLVGRVVSQSYVSNLATLSGSTIQLSPTSDVSDEIGSDDISFGEPLVSWDGQTLAVLRSTSIITVVHDLQQQDTTQLQRLAGLVVLSVIIVSLLVWWFVLRPIGVVSLAIQQQKPEILEKLRQQKTEFGRLAQIVVDFFAQKVTLADAELEKAELTRHANELHDEKAKLQASIEGLDIGFLLLSKDAQILLQNDALQKVLGQHEPIYSLAKLQETLPNLNLIEVCAAVQRSQQPQELNDMQAGTTALRFSITPVLVSRYNIRETIGAVVLVQDVTEEKILTRSRDEFFSIASHSLRTPLTAIRGNASMIIDQHEQAMASDPELKEMIDDIHESSNRLIEIVSDFLDASLLEQNKMEFKPEVVTVTATVDAALDRARDNLATKNLELKSNISVFDKPPVIWADPVRFAQIVDNLVNNAVTFTSSGSIAVIIDTLPTTVELRINDTGEGISLATQKLLFRKFQQAGGSLLTRATTRGTGMGLYNSKLIAERMGGSLELESSEIGKGSTFLLTMPKPTLDQKFTASNTTKHDKIDVDTGMSRGDNNED